MDRRRALGAVAAMVVAILAGCASPAAGSLAPDTTSPSPRATPPPTVKPTPATPSPSPAPRPTPEPNPTVPPKPTAVTFREDVECLDADCNEARTAQTVTWQTPRTKGITIMVYGVTECLAAPATAEPGSSGPCLVTHTRMPASVLTLLAEAPASAGTVSWSWTSETGCDIGQFGSDPDGPTYFAVALGAYNAAGPSVFAIAEPGEWSVPLPGEMPC